LSILKVPLIDDPKAWILRLFEMEEREGRGDDCSRFPEGTQPRNLPLEEGEFVLGIYKKKYHFTPASLIILEKSGCVRIAWSEVRSCSSRHGEGKTYSNVNLLNGQVVRVRVGDMAVGWSGRISQLFHQMIERYGHRAAVGPPMLRLQDFLTREPDDFSIAPNLYPHPSLDELKIALLPLEEANDGTEVFMDICEEDEGELVANGIVILTPRDMESFRQFVHSYRADGIVAADEATLRRIGNLPEGFKAWHILWD
jgi:hypothetical protein